jgi:hypothetical protein
LTGGTYVVSGTFKFPNADIRTNAATLVLDGSASQIVNQAGTNALTNLATIPTGGSFTIQNGRNFSAAVPFNSAGTVTIGAGSTFTATGTYTQTAGTLTGAGILTVTGLLTWSGGTMAGSGQPVANGGMALNGAADKVLEQRSFSNAGTATWTDTGNLVLGVGAAVTNQAGAIFDAQNDAAFVYSSGAAPTVTNAGTFRKSAGTGTTTVGSGITFRNTGTVQVQPGTLYLQGLFTNFADTTLTGGTYLISGTLKFTNADIRTNSATVVLDGLASAVVNQADGDGLANFGTNRVGASLTIRNGRTFTAGSFTNDGSLTVGDRSSFTASLTNFANTTLTGGSYVVSGTLKLTNAGEIRTNAASLVLDGPASGIVNQADVDALANLANISPTGRFTIQNGRNFTPAAAVPFTNAGNLTIDAGTFIVSNNYTQTGTLNVRRGTFQVNGSFTNFNSTTGILNGGTYLIEGNEAVFGFLRFPNANIRTNNNANLVLDGPGSRIVDQAGNDALANFGTNRAGASFTIRNGRTFTAGSFTNDGSLTVGDRSTFTASLTNFTNMTLIGGSYVVSGTLKLTNAGEIRTNATSLVLDGPASGIVNQADVDALANLANIPPTGRFTIQNGRNFTATAAFSTAGTVTVGAGSRFTATGTYTQTGGTLNGAGNLIVTGLLTWTGGTMSDGGQTLANGGLAISGAAGKTIAQRTLSNAGAGTWTGPSTIDLIGGSFHNLAGATFDIQNDSIFRGGVGVNTVTNDGTFRRSAGTGTTWLIAPVRFTNTGTVQVLTGRLLLEGPFTNFTGTSLRGGTYVVSGIIMLPTTGADIRTNEATIVLDGPASQITSLSGINALRNLATNTAEGSFTIRNGRDFTTARAFSNAGSVTVGSGSTFTVTGTYTQTAGSTTLGGGTLTASSGAGTQTVNLQGGNLSGSGIINAHLVNAGQVSPGGTGAAGLLTVNGNYTQAASGTLNLEIGGLTAGTQYDRLSVSGAANLNGNLSVAAIGGFLPNISDSFQVLTFGSRSGTFANFNGLDLGSDRVLRPIFDATGLTLVTNNRPPILEAIADQEGTVGTEASLTAMASDPDGDGLTFSLDEAPEGAVIDAATGLFTWTPAAAGTFTVTIRVSDSGSPSLFATRTFTITVT